MVMPLMLLCLHTVFDDSTYLEGGDLMPAFLPDSYTAWSHTTYSVGSCLYFAICSTITDIRTLGAWPLYAGYHYLVIGSKWPAI